MHPFAETAPEFTTATVKQVAEIVKHSKKRVDGQEFSAAASYSHRKMLPTW
jgi:hypothetical protein